MSTALFDPIKAQSKVTDSVIVAFSGGKESVVTLDLCCRYFKNVRAFFMYEVPDISFQQKTIRWYEKKYGIEIEQLPHTDLSEFIRYGTFRQPDLDCPIISINDIYHYVRLKYDIWWIAAGERIDDSIIRRAMIKHSGTIDVQRGRFCPVANWSKKDILTYIDRKRLYLGQDSKILGHSLSNMSGETLYQIKTYFPDDYEKYLKIFPFAGAAVLRYEKYGN